MRDASAAVDVWTEPFFVADARREGMRWHDLQAKRWRRLSYGQYASTALRHDARLTLEAVARRLPDEYAFSGRTAAWIHGLDMPPCEPIEVTVDRNVPVRARAGVRLRRAALPKSDVTLRDGFRVTSPLRTVCDLGSRADAVESVVAIDMAVRAALVALEQIERHVASNPGAKGIRRLRRATALADPRSESPMETRMRILLVKARLPRPDVQVDLHDSAGAFLGRADLYYPDRKLILEYDGDNHKERLVGDMRRQNALVNGGYHLLRFTAADFRLPGAIANQVRQARARLSRTIR